MRVSKVRVVSFTLALATGLALGIGARHLLATKNPEDAENRISRRPPVDADIARKHNTAAPWIQELRRLDSSVFPAFSMAYHTRFANAAAAAIKNNPRAAMKAFAASTDLHRMGCVEIFSELLCESYPLLGVELGELLPPEFSETVQMETLPALARLAPEKALEMIRNGAFPRIADKSIFTVFGSGMGRFGDISQLQFIRRALKGDQLESALWSFAEEFARTNPKAAMDAAAANPDIGQTLLHWAGGTLWKRGEVSAAIVCLGKAEKSQATQMVTDFVNGMRVVPSEALLPAFKKLIELNGSDSKVMPPHQLELLCETIQKRVAKEEPGKLQDYVQVVPEGPLRDAFLRKD